MTTLHGITLYGISNCDTIKKARRWLNDNGIEYRFHDYRKDGLTLQQLQNWSEELDWEELLNKRGTTWRKLPEEQKEGINKDQALCLMLEHPAMIKRPLLDTGSEKHLGFKPDLYKQIFAPITGEAVRE
ncbi:ArsC family transcriptional regulator [Endozoicomonas montiporae]|uniref:ArsC family transcriptional regulator n=2 Tax=Endozoicomonas montiporae TaxID=1027273 RepID=A0A081N8A4_9GAMM|nr:ArsC family reductase [Endozoicomonas montiporae]AMO55434.1 ArsC family protein [Endozoicomonas montiporae CL-33]KEQ14677.1 ArsC family transcriptional regulator [Endozoicomonas montiporae]